MGALSNRRIEKIQRYSIMSHVAMGIEKAMFRDGATRLTTRAVGAEVRVITEDGTKLHHFEEEGMPYFTHVPNEHIPLRLSRMRRYAVFSYGNEGARCSSRGTRIACICI